VARNAELAHDEHVQWRVECTRHLERHRHATAWQREDAHVGAIRILHQVRRQSPASLPSVEES